MTNITPEGWLSRVDSSAWDPGLERLSEVAAKLALVNPQPTVITVAGTNGKGSTCEYIERLCLAAGLRTGKTISPHFHRFNERIVINGVPASDAEIVTALEVIEAGRGETPLTYFEYAALAALQVFSTHELDVLILEIGLGGRLDAFNVVDCDIAVITRIALDHQAWLGDTREAIGYEKAGILREGCFCVLADPDPPQSVLDQAAALECRLYCVGRDFNLAENRFLLAERELLALDPSRLQLPPASAITALQVASLLSLPLETLPLADVLQTTALVGRMQWCGEDVLLDVAHNVDAANYLAAQLRTLGRPVTAVIGLYADKDIQGVLAELEPLVTTWHLCAADEARAAPTTMLADVLSGVSGSPASSYDKIADAVSAAMSAREGNELIVVCGSFPVVAAALSIIGTR